MSNASFFSVDLPRPGPTHGMRLPFSNRPEKGTRPWYQPVKVTRRTSCRGRNGASASVVVKGVYQETDGEPRGRSCSGTKICASLSLVFANANHTRAATQVRKAGDANAHAAVWPCCWPRPAERRGHRPFGSRIRVRTEGTAGGARRTSPLPDAPGNADDVRSGRGGRPLPV